MANIVIEAYLDKLGGKFTKKAQRRYIVVDGTSLEYYKDFKLNADGTRAKPQGVLSLVGATFEALPNQDDVYPFAIHLQTTVKGKKDMYTFNCPSEGERQRWLDVLRKQTTAGSEPKMVPYSLHEGNLWKYEQKTGGWSRLYGVLLADVFHAYNDRKAKVTESKKLPLKDCSLVASPETVPENRAYAFLIRKEAKDGKTFNFFLAAEDGKDYQTWIKKIKTALGDDVTAAASAKKPMTADEAAKLRETELNMKALRDLHAKGRDASSSSTTGSVSAGGYGSPSSRADADVDTKHSSSSSRAKSPASAAQAAAKAGHLAPHSSNFDSKKSDVFMMTIMNALKDESKKTDKHRRLASAMKKQISKEKKAESKRRGPRRHSSISLRRSFCDIQEGFYGTWKINKSDDMSEYWTYLGVPLPIRLILLNDPMERVTFEGDAETLTIRTRTGLFSEVTGYDKNAVEDRGHMVPHRWYDLLTFRGSICLKQMFWEDSEEDHLMLVVNTRLENKIGLVTEDFRLADDGDTMYQRLVLKTADKDPRNIVFRRTWSRVSDL